MYTEKGSAPHFHYFVVVLLLLLVFLLNMIEQCWWFIAYDGMEKDKQMSANDLSLIDNLVVKMKPHSR